MKEPLLLTEKEAVWALESDWMIRRKERSLVRAGNRTPDHPAHSLVTVPTMLSCLLQY
jgi:hypothetical protein